MFPLKQQALIAPKLTRFFSGNKENVSENINGSGRTIPRAYITTAKPNSANARVILGADALEEQVQEELTAMSRLRKECMTWAKDKIKQIQFEEAIKEKLNVKLWDDIGKEWKKDGGEDNQKRLYCIMHGVFERETKWNGKCWQQCLEEEFMTKRNLHYTSRDVNAEGNNKRKRKDAATGIQKIIMNERNESNKLINNRSRKTHRLCIIIKRIDGKRRKKDHFTNQYVGRHEINEREETKSKKMKQIKNEMLTIALNKENISALVKAQQKLNSNQAKEITEKVKKKKSKKNCKKKGTKNQRKKGQKCGVQK